MAPFVVGNRVMVGAAGGEFGIYGWLKGLDLKTGKIVWTARNIGPDAEVLARPDTFKPHYDKGTELAMKSWPENFWKQGGAPVWGWISYDPDLDLLYYGTGTHRPTTPSSAPATTSGLRACWRAVPPTDRWCGHTSSRRTTTGITTRTRR